MLKYISNILLKDTKIPLTLKNTIRKVIIILEEYKNPTITNKAYFIPLVLDPRIKLDSLAKLGYTP